MWRLKDSRARSTSLNSEGFAAAVPSVRGKMDLPISGLAARGAGVYRVGAFRIAWPHVPANLCYPLTEEDSLFQSW